MKIKTSFLLRLLFCIFLFAHRIKSINSINQFDLSNIGHVDVGCGKDQFECVASSKCIEKYMYCDYIVDCEDTSDENQCGTCTFQNGKVNHKKIFFYN